MAITDPNKPHLGGCVLQNAYKGDINTWSPQVWDNLIFKYQVKTLMDVGCGGGYSLRYFLSKGVKGIGIEGLELAKEVSPVKDKIILHDFTESPYRPDKPYDLGWCCEFVEHVEAKYVQNFMHTLSFCNVVAMTHALPGQNGYHHVNEQPPQYWIDVFKKYYFSYNEEYSLSLRKLLENKSNGHWVKNSLMIFEKY